jgi:hypothetical protein
VTQNAAMTTLRPALAGLLALVVTTSRAFAPAAASDASAATAAVAAPVFEFAGKPFVHRWSHGGQHDFTPPAQTDASKWEDMMTVQVYDKVHTPDQLAFVADSVLVAYQRSGQIIRKSTSQATPDRPTEHIVVAVLQDKGIREMAFARFRLTPEGGQAIVYSHRVYGIKPDEAAAAWFRANDGAIEKAMMTWTGLPSNASLQALPQSPS